MFPLAPASPHQAAVDILRDSLSRVRMSRWLGRRVALPPREPPPWPASTWWAHSPLSATSPAAPQRDSNSPGQRLPHGPWRRFTWRTLRQRPCLAAVPEIAGIDPGLEPNLVARPCSECDRGGTDAAAPPLPPALQLSVLRKPMRIIQACASACSPEVATVLG